jgi:hypothetical protein
MKERAIKLKSLFNRPKKSDLEKDLRNPVRRVVRHTLLKKKYGDMQHYYMDAADHHLAQPTEDIDEVIESANKEMDEYLEEQQKKREEAAAKKAEREAEREKKKAEREAKKAEKKAAKEVTSEPEEPEKEVNGVGSMKKGEDGLYHYSPVVFKDEKKEEAAKEPKTSKTSKKK